MKTTIAFVMLCLTVSLNALGQQELLKKAEEAYDARKYKDAVAAYQELVDDGYKSWQLYFNLGNAYYRNDQLGRAIYCYELARKLNPNDEDIRINLGIASAKTIDKIDAKENFFINAVKTNVLSTFSTTTWAWYTIVSLLLSALAFFLFVNSASTSAKRLSFVLASVMLIAFVLTYFFGYSALNAKVENKFAIVLVREVRIMNEPTAKATMKFNLHEGTKIRVVENNGDWLLIKLDNGNEGWVKSSEVGIV